MLGKMVMTHKAWVQADIALCLVNQRHCLTLLHLCHKGLGCS